MKTLFLIALLAFGLGMDGAELQKKLDSFPKLDGITMVHPVTGQRTGGSVNLNGEIVDTKIPIKLYSWCRIENGTIRAAKGQDAVQLSTVGDHGFHIGGELRDVVLLGGGLGIDYKRVYGDIIEVRLAHLWVWDAPGLGLNLWATRKSYRCQLDDVHAYNPGAMALMLNGHENRVTDFFVNGTYKGQMNAPPPCWILVGGWGTFDNVLLEVFVAPAVTGIICVGDYTISRLWSELTSGAPTLMAHGASAIVKLCEPELLSYNPIVATGGAKVRLEMHQTIPQSMLVGNVSMTATQTTD